MAPGGRLRCGHALLTPTPEAGGSGSRPALRLLLAWPHLLWGSSVGAASALGPLGNLGSRGFPPRFFWKQEFGGGGRGQGARIRLWSGGGGERVRQGTSWASDFRVIEADRGWLLDFFFFPPVVGGLRGGTLKAYF